jgi:DNA-binding LacI/PurR family transcriptional regulator
MSQVTLKQVAKYAGVSYQTVSKVLNHQGSVSKETEERIWEAVRTLGYRPNLIARSLRSQRSGMIGYSWEPAFPEQANAILDLFLRSMTEAAEAAGYHLLAFPFRPGKAWVDAYRELIDTNRVDGFVLSSVEYNDPRIQFLQERGFPFVAFGRSNPGWEFPCVDVHGGAGMRKVVEHLVERGHRRIAAIGWPEQSRVGQNRLDGFIEALQANGIQPNPEWIARGEGSIAFSKETVQKWLNLPPTLRPTAITAFNDIMAIGAMQAIRENGLEPGRDIAVTGFDDSPLVQYLTPSLTSVRQPIIEVGQAVMNLLLEQLNGERAVNTCRLIEPELIIRQSSSERCSSQ